MLNRTTCLVTLSLALMGTAMAAVIMLSRSRVVRFLSTLFCLAAGIAAAWDRKTNSISEVSFHD